MAIITTPVEGFTGSAAGVSFAEGIGETDDEGAIAYFTRQGYGVELDTDAPKEKPFSQLNKEELIELAGVEEIDISEATTNDEIRAAIKAARDK